MFWIDPGRSLAPLGSSIPGRPRTGVRGRRPRLLNGSSRRGSRSRRTRRLHGVLKREPGASRCSRPRLRRLLLRSGPFDLRRVLRPRSQSEVDLYRGAVAAGSCRAEGDLASTAVQRRLRGLRGVFDLSLPRRAKNPGAGKINS